MSGQISVSTSATGSRPVVATLTSITGAASATTFTLNYALTGPYGPGTVTINLASAFDWNAATYTVTYGGSLSLGARRTLQGAAGAGSQHLFHGSCVLFTALLCICEMADPPVPTMGSSVSASSGASTNGTSFRMKATFQYPVSGVALSDFVITASPAGALADLTVDNLLSASGGREWSVRVTVGGGRVGSVVTVRAGIADASGAISPVVQVSQPATFAVTYGA